jgi:hypothetical protein
MSAVYRPHGAQFPFVPNITSFAHRHHHMPSMCREISGAHNTFRRSDRFIFKVGRSKRRSQQVDSICDSEAPPRFLSHRFDATFSTAPFAFSKPNFLRAFKISHVYALNQLVETLTTKPTNTKTHTRDGTKHGKDCNWQQFSKHALLFLGRRGSGGRRFGCHL